MSGLPLAFAAPAVLTALLLLPVIWWLLRLTPPRPQDEPFPPFAILARLLARQETPAHSPWWLTLLRLLMAALVILALSGPIWNPQPARLAGGGPVTLVVDDGWASAARWRETRDTALALVDEAREAGRPVRIVGTTMAQDEEAELSEPDAARASLEALEARPLPPDHAAAAARLDAIQGEPGSLVILSDGLEHRGSEALREAAARRGEPVTLFQPGGDPAVAMSRVRNDPQALSGLLLRARSGAPATLTVVARDRRGVPLARRQISFAADAASAEFSFDEPVELRNQVMRLSVEEVRSAGAVQLLDERFRRRLVGLLSGESADISQPLLSPLYYIRRALAPFSDLRTAATANVADAVPDLLNQKVSALVMADVGTLPAEARRTLTEWIEQGGMLIRFAGPRLAATPDDQLLPVRLREGDRSLDGALSWDTPKPVAPFERSSPFFGIDPPREVAVSRQVLALQDLGLEEKTWAVLEDGTPLVTAERRGQGWIVLFHVTSDATWSNLPISGTFVEMLRRVVSQSRAGGARTAEGAEQRLAPLSLLDGSGELTAPGPESEPLVQRAGVEPLVTPANPPGLYGTEDGFVALNLLRDEDALTPLDADAFPPTTVRADYAREGAVPLKPWLLLAAALALVLDCLAVLWIGGAMARRLRPAALAVCVGLAAWAGGPPPALAQTPEATTTQTPAPAEAVRPEVEFAPSLLTRLAYVRTGDEQVDSVSEAGLKGLSAFLASRTALEPGEPVGVDVSSDELAFYPLLYWPISLEAPMPDATAMSRLDAFMKGGGTVLFDTRDEGSALGGGAGTAEARRLQEMLASLDVPPLEPVPADHVLTKAFYLLSGFPGRFASGELWIEATQAATVEGETQRPARAGDGVSSIIITGNDLAGAWAVGPDMQPLLPTVPPDPAQREYAFRGGVNLVMYAYTGNYKADQVHVPALLERLGQ